MSNICSYGHGYFFSLILIIFITETYNEERWDNSGFLRPRIFCLEHAVQVEKLLQSKGGSKMLVICHSGKLLFYSFIFLHHYKWSSADFGIHSLIWIESGITGLWLCVVLLASASSLFSILVFLRVMSYLWTSVYCFRVASDLMYADWCTHVGHEYTFNHLTWFINESSMILGQKEVFKCQFLS